MTTSDKTSAEATACLAAHDGLQYIEEKGIVCRTSTLNKDEDDDGAELGR